MRGPAGVADGVIGPHPSLPTATYATGGATAVDAIPGGKEWRTAIGAPAPEGERHLLTFEGHVTHLPERDRALLDHIDVTTMVGGAPTISRKLDRIAQAVFREVMYTASGPDVARELRTFADAYGLRRLSS